MIFSFLYGKLIYYIGYFIILIIFLCISNSLVIRDEMVIYNLISSELIVGFVE